MITSEIIKEYIEQHFQLSKDIIDCDYRNYTVSNCRKIAWYIASILTTESDEQIGKTIGKRDRTSVIAGIKSMRKQKAINGMQNDINEIIFKLLNK